MPDPWRRTPWPFGRLERATTGHTSQTQTSFQRRNSEHARLACCFSSTTTPYLASAQAPSFSRCAAFFFSPHPRFPTPFSPSARRLRHDSIAIAARLYVVPTLTLRSLRGPLSFRPDPQPVDTSNRCDSHAAAFDQFREASSHHNSAAPWQLRERGGPRSATSCWSFVSWQSQQHPAPHLSDSTW